MAEQTGDRRRDGVGATDPEDIESAGETVDPAAPDLHGDALIGETGDGATDPEGLVDGNRVATAEDME